MSSFLDLAPELMSEIFSYVSIADLVELDRCCRFIHYFVVNVPRYEIWTRVAFGHFPDMRRSRRLLASLNIPEYDVPGCSSSLVQESKRLARNIYLLNQVFESEWNSHARVKVTIVGDGDSGKWRLLLRLLGQEHESQHRRYSAICKSRRQLALNGLLFSLGIFGTSDLEKCGEDIAMPPAIYKDSHLVMVLFDVTRPATEERVYTKWLPEINLRKQKGILPVQTPVFVMGHKIDLAMNEENANAVKNSSEFLLRHPFPISDEAYAKTWSSLPSTDPLRSRIVKFITHRSCQSEELHFSSIAKWYSISLLLKRIILFSTKRVVHHSIAEIVSGSLSHLRKPVRISRFSSLSSARDLSTDSSDHHYSCEKKIDSIDRISSISSSCVLSSTISSDARCTYTNASSSWGDDQSRDNTNSSGLSSLFTTVSSNDLENETRVRSSVIKGKYPIPSSASTSTISSPSYVQKSSSTGDGHLVSNAFPLSSGISCKTLAPSSLSFPYSNSPSSSCLSCSSTSSSPSSFSRVSLVYEIRDGELSRNDIDPCSASLVTPAPVQPTCNELDPVSEVVETLSVPTSYIFDS